MTYKRYVTALTVMLILPGATKPLTTNWNNTITVTPTGSHILGNPAAALKLTEYVSYTCPHCAEFEREGTDRMRSSLVVPGRLSIEVRHLVRDPIDMTVALLTNCGPAAKFTINHQVFLGGQSRWLPRLNTSTPAMRQRWTSGTQTARLRAIATDFGFYAIMATRGYDRPTVDRCLADTAMANRLAQMTKAAAEIGVESTPTFLLNGQVLAGTHDWPSLKLQLEARTAPIS